MKRRTLWFAVLLGALVAGTACGGDLIDAQVVVHETNTDPMGGIPPACPDSPFRYELEVDLDCGGTADATVCSDRELCQSQIDAALASLRSCEQTASYDTGVPAGCD